MSGGAGQVQGALPQSARLARRQPGALRLSLRPLHSQGPARAEHQREHHKRAAHTQRALSGALQKATQFHAQSPHAAGGDALARHPHVRGGRHIRPHRHVLQSHPVRARPDGLLVAVSLSAQDLVLLAAHQERGRAGGERWRPTRPCGRHGRPLAHRQRGRWWLTNPAANGHGSGQGDRHGDGQQQHKRGGREHIQEQDRLGALSHPECREALRERTQRRQGLAELAQEDQSPLPGGHSTH